MVAASILPITIHKNQLLFLFGKENELEDSAKGWSDFGGRVDPGETIFQGALREGSEELTGFLGNNKNACSFFNTAILLSPNDIVLTVKQMKFVQGLCHN